MNRGVRLLLAVVGGAGGALAIVMAGTVMLMGVLWLYVFGDDSWPRWVDPALDIAIPVVGLLLWAYLGCLIWRRLAGLRQEG